jgi:hypothetical protein
MRYLGLTWTGLSAFNPPAKGSLPLLGSRLGRARRARSGSRPFPTRASTVLKAARSKPIGRVAVFSNGAGFPGVRAGMVATLPRFPLQGLLAAWAQTT